MIKVCDAIMGTGKSSAAITYMNEHPDERFIYITPYLEEVERITNDCPNLHFVQPSNKIKEYEFSKCVHTAELIRRGCNIATTHQAFKRYTQEMLDNIHNFGYHLIIDENMEILEQYDIHYGDIQLALDAGYIEDNGDSYRLTNKEYKGRVLRDMFNFLESRELIQLRDENGTHLYYWILPPQLIASFSEVIILTYLFEGQGLHHFIKLSGFDYEYIGIELGEDGKFRFGEAPGYVPPYVDHLKDMLHIIDNDKLNAVGDEYYALSMSWFGRDDGNEGGNAEKMRSTISNISKNVWKGVPVDKKMIGAFVSTMSSLRGKGYTNAMVTCNLRATNNYRDKKYLMYITNLFMNVGEKLFYKRHGIEVNEDMYALSTMVQWIWRSAIRDGEEVYLYIPSKRMRTLLINWIDRLSKRGCEN